MSDARPATDFIEPPPLAGGTISAPARPATRPVERPTPTAPSAAPRRDAPATETIEPPPAALSGGSTPPTAEPPPGAGSDKSHTADRERQDAKLPPGMQQLQKLSDAGFSGQEIDRYKAEKTQTLLAAGFKPAEITEYWGDNDPDLRKLTGQITSNIAAAKTATSATEMFRAGLQMGSTSLPFGPPNIIAPEHQSLAEKILFQSGMAVNDIPATIAGFVGGFAAGTPGGPLAQFAVGGAASAALPEGIREGLMDYYTHAGAQAQSWSDIWARVSGVLLGTGKAAAVGAVAGGVGGALGGRVLAAGGSTLAATGANIGSATAAATVAGAALEGRVPEADDFIVGATLAIGMGAAGHFVGMANRFVPNKRTEDVATNLRDIYAKTGMLPKDVVEKAQADPALASDILAPRAADGSFVGHAARQLAPPEPEPHTQEGQIRPPDAFKAPATGASAAPTPTPAHPDIAIGDSIAAHLIRRAGVGGQEDRTTIRSFRPGDTAVSGYNPVEIRDQVIPQIPDEQIRGKNVILSTGASNGPTQLDAIPGQIAALKARGAKSITIMGVGTHESLRGVNDQLQAIAAQAGEGVQFSGPLKYVAGDQIHSSDPRGEIQATPIAPPPASSANILGPYATGNARVGGPSGVERVNTEFANRIDRMAQAMPPEIRARFEIISGFRDAERQAEVNPGVTNSHHMHGLAVDTTNDPTVIQWINEHGHEYGVGYTINHLPNEQNHLEPTENGQRIPPGSVQAWVAHNGRTGSILEIPTKGEEVSPELLNVFHTLEGSGIHAISPAGAVGRGQIMPDTARQYGFDPGRLQEPGYNEMVTRHVIADLAQKFNGNLQDMLVAYNAGPGRARAWIAGGRRTEDLPVETQHYLENAERQGFLDKGYMRAQADRQLTLQGDDGEWVPPETPGGRIEPPPLAEGGFGGRGPPGPPEPPTPRSAGEPGEQPQITGPADTRRPRYDNLSDEALASSIFDHMVGEPEEKSRWLRPRDIAAAFQSQLAPARAFDRERGLDGHDIGAEDMLRQTFASKERAGYFVRWGILDAITLRQKSDASLVAAFHAVRRDGGNVRDFLAYMLAKRNQEKREQGIDTGGFPELDDEYTQRASVRAKYERGAETLRQVNHGAIDYARDSGMFSEAGAAAMKAQNEWYVTYRRIMDPEYQPPRAPGRDFTVRRAAREMEGSQRQITDPLTATIDNLHTLVAMADRNRAIGAIINMERGTPPEQALFQMVAPFEVRRNASGRVVDANGHSLMDEWTDGEGKPVDPNAMIDEARKAMETFSIYRAAQGGLGKGDFLYFNEGKPEIWHTHDEGMAEVLRMASAAPPNVFVKMLQPMARLQRSGITAAFDFPIRAITHGQLAAAAFADRGAWVPYHDVMTGFMHTWNQDGAYRRWVASGGAGTALSDMDANYLAKDVNAIFEATGQDNAVWNAFKHPIEAARALQHMIDAASRVGMMTRLEAEGESSFKAAMLSRTGTFDHAEGRAAAYLRSWATTTPFMEIGFKDFEQVVRAVRERPRETLIRAGLVLVAPTVINYALNLLADPFLDPADRYSQLPQWERDMYWNLPPIFGARLKIKKPYVGAFPFSIVPERFLDTIKGDAQSAGSWARAVWDQMVAPFTPTLLYPGAETWSNQQFYTGRPLINSRLEQNSGYQQYQPDTTETAKALARLLGAPGLRIAEGPSRLPLANPRITDEFLRQWTGTLPFTIFKTLDATAFKPSNRPWQIADTPFLGSFFVRHTPGGQKSIEDFHSEFQNFEASHKDLLLSIKRGDVASLPASEFRHAAVAQALHLHNEALSNMSKTIQAIYENKTMTNAEKRKATDGVAGTMLQTAQSGLAVMKALR